MRLARAMGRVVNDQRLRKRLISMGYERVKEFSWDKAAKATLDVIVGEGYNIY
jgi:glycosyltransferase involved in cell wall biosynthesis